MRIDNILQEPVSAKDFRLAVPVGLVLPESVDLRAFAGPIEDQLSTGSCVANATVSALEMMLQRADRFSHLSRLFVYWNIREGNPKLEGKDNGAFLVDGFKSVYRLGVCDEQAWGFDPEYVNTKPPMWVYASATQFKATKYQRVGQYNQPDNAKRIKTALAMGYSVTVSLYISDELFKMTGPLSSPTCHYNGAGKAVGGHAMNLVGYDSNGFIAENSWGDDWGDNGFCILTYGVTQNVLMDAWTCTAFAGIDQEPDFTWTPASPIVATARDYSQVGYLQSSKDTKYHGCAVVDATGGEAHYTYRWTASDPCVTITDETQWPVPQVDMTGWAKGETRSIKLTCEVFDSTIPAQSTTIDTLIRVCNSVDIESIKGKAYRLYKAAFARVPDDEGLMYWIRQLGSGMELREVAARFMDSAEFATKYGINVSDRDFLTALYFNVLGREPDDGGYSWWLGRLASGYARCDALVSFSESPENKAGAQW